VNSVTRGENELFHLGVPPLGLMTEMNPGFQQLFDCYGWAMYPPLFHPATARLWWARDIQSLTTGF